MLLWLHGASGSSDTCQLNQSCPLGAVLYRCGATVLHNSYNVSCLKKKRDRCLHQMSVAAEALPEEEEGSRTLCSHCSTDATGAETNREALGSSREGKTAQRCTSCVWQCPPTLTFPAPPPRPIPQLSQELPSAAEHRAKLCWDLLPFLSCSSARSLASSSGRAADPTRAIGMLL